MLVILVFFAFVVVGDTIVIGISSAVEQFSKTSSLFVFLALFVAVFVVAWHAAVYVTERYIVRQN